MVAKPPDDPSYRLNCRTRELLGRIGDKWSLGVLHQLMDGTKRFTELRRELHGISHRMLTVTVRALERDGLVRRTVHPVVPPRVDYTLTPLGDTLATHVNALMAWVDDNIVAVDTARAQFDKQEGCTDTPAGSPTAAAQPSGKWCSDEPAPAHAPLRRAGGAR
ncbi:helix-turn-helix domain-containing protein [Lentzea sp. NPDC051208]|uniref:winged helix-turn-helix transcriptional regulator n=1 Tax=Lentzea sp. NPDC051208 TaxID=3154642 RepID=UPI00343DC6C4